MKQTDLNINSVHDLISSQKILQEYSGVEKRLAERESEVKQLRFECKRRRKMIEMQQNCIYQGKDLSEFGKVKKIFVV